MRLLFAIGVAVSLQTAQAETEAQAKTRVKEETAIKNNAAKYHVTAAAGGDTLTGKKPDWGFGAVSQARHEAWINDVKSKIGGTTWDGAQRGKDLFQGKVAGEPGFPNLKKGLHMERSEATFNRYATDYKWKMDRVQNGIEGLAQLHTTHDEMWHRICAIAERGAKDSMIKFQKAILEFKKSMIAFRTSHTAMLKAKQQLEVRKQSMIMALQKWLTARKAHAHAHARYVNFLHHLGLNFNDRNPAARYWRTYAHGETGRRDDGSLVGGWTPARGPSTLIGKHSHKAFINNLESVAVTPAQGAGGLQNWYDDTAGNSPTHTTSADDGNGGTVPTPKGYGKVNGRDGWNKPDEAMTLMEDPFWAHRDDKNDISYSGLYQLSQAGKVDGGKTNDWGTTPVSGLPSNARDTAAPTGQVNADSTGNTNNQR